MNNYIKIKEIYGNNNISGTVYGNVKVGDLVELYDSINNSLNIFSHIESINIFGIEYDSLSHGITASFICPGFNEDFLDKGMKIVVCEE